MAAVAAVAAALCRVCCAVPHPSARMRSHAERVHKRQTLAPCIPHCSILGKRLHYSLHFPKNSTTWNDVGSCARAQGGSGCACGNGLSLLRRYASCHVWHSVWHHRLPFRLPRVVVSRTRARVAFCIFFCACLLLLLCVVVGADFGCAGRLTLTLARASAPARALQTPPTHKQHDRAVPQRPGCPRWMVPDPHVCG
jgi:hypothetical protein